MNQNKLFQPGQILGSQPVPRQDCPGGEIWTELLEDEAKFIMDINHLNNDFDK